MHLRAPLVILSLLVLVAGATAQKAKVSQHRQGFVLNSYKPFVYLEFERIGDRQPLREGETSRGVWLRLENNCSLPLKIEMLGGSRWDVIHEVVYDELEYLWRPQIPRSEMPSGYTYDTRASQIIQPGHSFKFSVPVEHITADWHIEVPFEFDLPLGRTECCQPQPRMNVVFTFNQVAIESRPLLEWKKSQTRDGK